MSVYKAPELSQTDQILFPPKYLSPRTISLITSQPFKKGNYNNYSDHKGMTTDCSGATLPALTCVVFCFYSVVQYVLLSDCHD